MLQCYNKGCGQKFDKDDNNDQACRYHPGHPIFHDAKKGWSCCNKFSTDFSVFLSMPGCTTGLHSNEKPPEQAKPDKLDPKYDTEVVVVRAPKERIERLPRPSPDEPMIPLKVQIMPSNKTELERALKMIALEENTNDVDSSEVPVGTECKNNGCKTKYESPETNKDLCYHHPGVAIFHEGYKFWTCCKRRTTEWESFIAQVGCGTGKHSWFKKPSAASTCRHDYFQTAKLVTFTVYCKAGLPETSLVQANGVKLKVHLEYEGGQAVFDKEFNLHGIIDLGGSNVKFLGTKVEINLKKAEAEQWPSLERVEPKKKTDEGDANSED